MTDREGFEKFGPIRAPLALGAVGPLQKYRYLLHVCLSYSVVRELFSSSHQQYISVCVCT